MRIRLFYGIYLILGIIYLLTIPYRPYSLSFLVKVIPIGLLMVLAIYNFKTISGRLFGLALIFSCFGDILLELRVSQSFIAGLVAFLMAHVFYLMVFARDIRHTIPRILVAGLIVLYGLLIGDLLHLKLGALVIPVITYLCVLTAMTVSSIMGGSNHPITMLGAVLFLISDSIMAVNLFVTDISHSSFFVMVSYYLAQLLIFSGYFHSQSKLSTETSD